MEEGEKGGLEFVLHLFVSVNGQFTRVFDKDIVNRLIAIARGNLFDIFDDVHAVEDPTEDDVSSVQMACLDGANEELSAIGITSCVGHGYNARSGVLELEVFIVELAAIDRVAASAVSAFKVSALDHERADHTVEFGALVTKPFLARGKSTEVLSSPRHIFAVKTDDDTPNVFVVVRNIKVHLVRDRRVGGGSCRRHAY